MLLLAAAIWRTATAQSMADSTHPASSLSIEQQRNLYGQNKTIPAVCEKEVLAALAHFPELKKTNVTFKLQHSHSTLKTKINFWSILNRRDRRKYTVVISTQSEPKLEPLLFKNLPEQARIGILGHELSHVSDFSKKSFFQCMGVGLGHLSQSYLDSLEYHTDRLCIHHGLGPQLKTWSSFIRETMKVENWRGSDFVDKPESKIERYMNPSTIDKEMAALQSQRTTQP